MTEAEKIREELKIALNNSDPDARLIAKLSNQLLDLTDNEVRFSVDADHINRLGRELVSKHDTALSELVKNAYDADATEVKISLSDFEQTGGRLIVEDNGVGMDAETLKNSWMRISTSEKVMNPHSKFFGRRRAGKKGIGRFSAQRLGKTLVLETKQKGKNQGLRVSFNWDDDYTQGRSLLDVWNKLETFDKALEDCGTVLKINDLRNRWTDKTLDSVWRSIELLQPPFQISKINYTPKGKPDNDPGFKVTIHKDGYLFDQEISIETKLLQYAFAEINGEVFEDGTAVFEVDASRKGFPIERTEAQRRYAKLGPTKFKAYYFIYLAEAMPGSKVKEATRMGHEYGGIRVYRNGFRVHPYGEPKDDWLNLAKDTARRHLLIPSNNFNYFGQIEIDSVSNPDLDETSSREGLIENEAFLEMAQFVRSGLEWGAIRVAALRQRKQTSGQKGYEKKEVEAPEKPSTSINEVKNKLSNLAVFEGDWSPSSTESFIDQVSDILEEAKENAEAYEKAQENLLEESLAYEGMLRILASLGISVSIFGHEIKGINSRVGTELNLTKHSVNELPDGEIKTTLLQSVSNLTNKVDRLFDLGGYIASLVQHTESRSLKNVPVRKVFRQFFESFSDQLNSKDIEFEYNVNPPGLRTCEMHRSELDAVLFNLLTNSIKAIDRTRQPDPIVKVDATDEEGQVIIRFQDNGGGIDPAIEDKIFDTFFTTTEYQEDEISGPGTGLGLRIVSDIASSYGGSVKIVKADDGLDTCFEFRVLKG